VTPSASASIRIARRQLRNPANTDCTDADTCNAGVCQFNHESWGRLHERRCRGTDDLNGGSAHPNKTLAPCTNMVSSADTCNGGGACRLALAGVHRRQRLYG
jgi:hypothetical protein